MFTLDELRAAAALVHATVPPTPQYVWPLLAAASGCEVWVKHENHTPIGAFKVRGGLVYLDELVRSGRPRGLVTATRGNHGQSIPFAAAHHGIPVTVLVPKGNSADKNRAMAAWGARVETFGRDFDEARVEAERRAREEGLVYVPPFHPALVRGVATYALELFEAVSDLDAVYVPIGMGSGICGLVQIRDLLGLATEIVGVVSAHAPAFARSFAAGRVVTTERAATLADGIACRVPHPEALAIVTRGAARILEVTDDEVAEAMRLLYSSTHNVAEGAGAAALAAVLQERDAMAGRRVAVILTGGNVDPPILAAVLSGETPPPS